LYAHLVRKLFGVRVFCSVEVENRNVCLFCVYIKSNTSTISSAEPTQLIQFHLIYLASKA